MKGHISISYVRSSEEDDFMRISIDDQSSGITFLDVDLSMLNYAKVTAGLGYIPCEFTLRHADNIGKKLETKTEIVFVPKCDYHDREAVAADAVDDFDHKGEEGWVGRVSDAMNHHRLVRTSPEGGYYKVTYQRFV